MLVLDEPTAGLDPKQIIESRQLIKELGGSHTVVLSTHILPEVSQTCQRVVIINKGKVVAVDTPDNLTARLRGSETMFLQVHAPGADVAAALAGGAGRDPGPGRARRATASSPSRWTASSGRDVRRDLAAAVVTRGWGLLELRPMRMSLEDIFLSLTTEDADEADAAAPRRRQRRPSMRNVVTIARKELQAYFASPIAYVVIGFFALLFGYFFYTLLWYFERQSMQVAMGSGQTMNINQMLIGPVFMNVSVIVLFVMPMITMRTYSEEKRSGTIELLLTSPLTDLQIILGKFLGALTPLRGDAGGHLHPHRRAVLLRQPRVEAGGHRLPRACC